MSPLKPVQKKITATTEDLEQIFDIPVGTWSSWRSKGIGPKFSKLGKKVVYLLTDVENFLLDHKLKRIKSRSGRVVAFKQNNLDLPPKTETFAQEPPPEMIEAVNQEGKKETFRSRNLSPPTPDMNFQEMIEAQIRAVKAAAEEISLSKTGRAFSAQTIATLEVMAAWICQIERKAA